MNDAAPPRVRFAPSPTGSLHVGGARTALYNLLFARHAKGTFVLRIEDTDVERSREELTAQILSAMEWLGLDYDEGPSLPVEAVRPLPRRGGTAHSRRARPTGPSRPPRSSTPRARRRRRRAAPTVTRARRRDIPIEESDRRAAAGERHVVRLKMPAEPIVVDDLIRGRVEFPADALDDFVLVRSDGHPLYHFCVCVDDTDMRITHVIRGDDHLANTPKHVALFRALGAPVPKFAHLGMILGTDRKKLSKRHGAAAVEEWRDAGILPEALVNFLALLGWAPGGDREILTREEMEREFTLEKVGASPSVFDPEKLLWMNAQYIAAMPAEELLDRSTPVRPGRRPRPGDGPARRRSPPHARRARWSRWGARSPPTRATPPSTSRRASRNTPGPRRPRQLERLAKRFEALPEWTAAATEAALRETAEAEQIPAGKLIHPVRLALTGVTVGAPLFDVVELLGRETALRRLEKFVAVLAARRGSGRRSYDLTR